MSLGTVDLVIFGCFLLVVVAVSLYAGRREGGSEDYFLAGRSLGWPLIGFSLIASNISTEHFVGMAGSAFGRVGLAIASYEWMAAVTLVVVAWWLLPRFLRAGIYTMPEYLEYRYDRSTRTVMAMYLMTLYVVALLATVLYSGAKGLEGVFGFSQYFIERYNMTPDEAVEWSTVAGAWMIGTIAAVYTIYGGLKSVVWSDLLQGGALLIGGVIVTWFGFRLVGGGEIADSGGIVGGSFMDGIVPFAEVNGDKLHTVLPWNDPDIPWLAVFVGGLWIPNLFYWGLNQFITQRTLGARGLAQGQKGIFFAAWIKLIIPFIIVIPGIMAFQLFGDEILQRTAGDVNKAGEIAYPYMIAKIMPVAFRGIMLAALAGAVMSTFNSGINSAATVFTIDIYGQFINKEASPRKQVRVGRIATAVIAVLACLMAPLPGKFEGVFAYIQEIWGFISPGIVACFIGGILLKRAPSLAGRAALILGPVIYALFRIPGWVLKERADTLADGSALEMIYEFSTIAFLHHMAIIFILLFTIMVIITRLRPLAEPRTMPCSDIDLEPCRGQYVHGVLVILAAAALYLYFW